ncbi:cation:proton antiporter [Arcobacter sp. FWKO B]|uniref:cation:proton antiporter n=1 Tax=Arcobacter sp. FWKO B TaxID=2593672 RepID=UPI0018A667AF|nr:monovalent cation/H(+) antiporter subunit G [Arcobacter sp. FWKO B]QOG13153.1 monovalent cation/H(+) antiporter subunit G [Arcobacter sp. FWKO B]
MINIIGNIFLLLGVLFFIIGTVGLFRFFDLYTRLHAIAKIDNLGLGFIVFGLIIKCDNIFIILKLLLIWALVLLTSSTLTYIISSHSNKSGEIPKISQEVKDDNN